ncbi:hypothetical protein BaRGS_00026143 [Batillaria attramentaria]|uniref:Uncharacterized protein n=1 Tax=Batillaria attramentaria TaxID=370345 RepID=A0ABD0K5Y0_9CAEN
MPNLQQLSLMNSPGLAKALVKLLAENYTKPLEHVTEVDLTYSDIETISPDVREVFPALNALYLDGNPWLCDKRLTWLKEWMTDSDISFSQYEEVKCEQPYSLKGRPIKDIDQGDFVEVAPPTKAPTQQQMSEMLSRQNANPEAGSNEVVAPEDAAAAEKANLVPFAMVDAPAAKATTTTPESPTTKRLRRRRKYRQGQSRRQRKGKRSGDSKGKKSDKKRQAKTWQKGQRKEEEKTDSQQRWTSRPLLLKHRHSSDLDVDCNLKLEGRTCLL